MNLPRCCQGSIDGKRVILMDQGSVKKLLVRQSAQKFGSVDQRSYREFIEKKTQKSRWIENLLRSFEKRERRLDRKRIYRGSVEKLSNLKKGSFSREEKHIKMNATSKLLNQRSNQYIKLLRHRSIYKHSIHRSKNTHTHTHTH